MVLLVGCGGSGIPDGMSAISFDDAVVAEHGVIPVVADVSGIVPDGVEPVIVRLLDQETDGLVWLLAHDSAANEPLVSVTYSPDDAYPPRHDEQLLMPDGSIRWVEVGDPPPGARGDRSIVFAFGTGRVTVGSGTASLEDLRDIAAGLSIDGISLSAPAGWNIVGSHERNIFADGFAVSYAWDDGSEGVSIFVDRRDGDRIAGVRADGATQLPLGLDQAVFVTAETDPESLVDDLDPVRRVFTDFADNRFVMVSGRLTDPEFRQIVSTLREIEPDEFQIIEPDEY